jgi:hypothetical protein
MRDVLSHTIECDSCLKGLTSRLERSSLLNYSSSTSAHLDLRSFSFASPPTGRQGQKKTNQKKRRPKKMLPHALAGARPLFWEANAQSLFQLGLTNLILNQGSIPFLNTKQGAFSNSQIAI